MAKNLHFLGYLLLGPDLRNVINFFVGYPAGY